MIEKIQLTVTGITMIGVWINMVINLERGKKLDKSNYNSRCGKNNTGGI